MHTTQPLQVQYATLLELNPKMAAKNGPTAAGEREEGGKEAPEGTGEREGGVGGDKAMTSSTIV